MIGECDKSLMNEMSVSRQKFYMDAQMRRKNRREFLKTSHLLAASCSVGYFTSSSPLKARSPNEQPRLAVIGVGGQGMGDGRRAQNSHPKIDQIL